MRFAVMGLLLAASPSLAQRTAVDRKAWNVPVAPFRIIGNVHYVGVAGVSAFLITTPDGAIVLDGGMPETAPLIARNIEKLGVGLRDVRYLLNSHAHFDHAGGLADLRKRSGATLVASARDAEILRAGGPDMPPVPVGRVIADGQAVELGGTTLTAHVTPGHTKGCTTWTMSTEDDARRYDVLFYCSTSVVDRLVGNTRYPDIVADYERSFAVLRSMRADVFLGNHPAFFDLAGKRRRMSRGGPNPFVDPAELGRYVEESERGFRAVLKKEQGR